jgi:hypothetical protein
MNRNNTLPGGWGQIGAGLAGNAYGVIPATGQQVVYDPLTNGIHANID